MEWLKNLVTPISERVKSPFYSSIIISWLVFNWKIPTALFFYNEVVNNVDKIEYIYELLNNYKTSIIYPLISAFTYIFILPKIDEFVFGYSEKSKQRKLKKKIAITESGIVNGKRHIDLYNRFMKQKDELADVEEDLRVEKEKIDEIKKERDLSKKEKKEIQIQLENYQNQVTLLSQREGLNGFFMEGIILTRQNKNEKFKEEYYKIDQTDHLKIKEGFTYHDNYNNEIEFDESYGYNMYRIDNDSINKTFKCILIGDGGANGGFDPMYLLYLKLDENNKNRYKGHISDLIKKDGTQLSIKYNDVYFIELANYTKEMKRNLELDNN